MPLLVLFIALALLPAALRAMGFVVKLIGLVIVVGVLVTVLGGH
jgi:hypothetical protein